MTEEREPGACRDCGEQTTAKSPNNSWEYLCATCRKARERAYDNYVDPLGWYHQHDPDRICEG
jgi:hypothetical protein